MNKFNFNDSWSFYRSENETSPVTVTLPHDAMLFETRSADSAGGTGCAFYQGGTYIYEKDFDVPEEWADKSVRLEFEGAYRNTTVYINGKKAAVHAYGYTPFFIDCNKYLEYGRSNHIRAEVDNSNLPNTRWYSGSGIYRPVWLYVAEQKHIENVRITTLSYEPAKIKVDTSVNSNNISKQVSGNTAANRTANDGAMNQTADNAVRIQILDGEQIIAESIGISAEFEIADAKLWSEESPYLYTCKVSLDNGESLTESFGIRQIEYSNKGLFINGQSVKLRGGCVHHDNGILGACTYDEAEERRVKIMKETGFNAIRAAHNPCSKAFLRACDKYGMYLIEEMWDMWYERKNRCDYALDFEENYLSDVKTVAIRDYNHPCVIMYSIGNENMEPFNEKGVSTARSIVKAFHECDSTRPVTMGMNPSILYGASKGKGLYKDPVEGEEAKAAGSTLFNMIMMLAGTLVQKFAATGAVDKVISPCADELDITGYNYAADRYKKDKKKHPQRLLYGSETMPYHIFQNWEKVMKYDHVCGDFMWTAWDYLGEAGIGSWSYRKEAAGFSKQYPWKLAEVGAIDLLGNAGAEAVYAAFVWGQRTKPYIAVTPPTNPGEKLNRAYWRGTNAVESWSWHRCDGNATTVEVYAVGDSIQLEVNGNVIGKQPLKNYKAKFDTTYQPGTLKAVVLDAAGNTVAEQSLATAEGDLQLTLSADKENALAGGVVFIEVALTGDNKIIESNQDKTLTVTVDGGELLGFGSAQPCTEERFVSGTYTTYMGRALATLRKTSDKEMTVTVRGDGLKKEISL